MFFYVFRWWKRNAKQANPRRLFHDPPLQVSLTHQDQWKAQRRQSPQQVEWAQECQRLREALTSWRTWRGYSRHFERMILSGIVDCRILQLELILSNKLQSISPLNWFNSSNFSVWYYPCLFCIFFAQVSPSPHMSIRNRAELVLGWNTTSTLHPRPV